ncbi:MAG: ATP-dependent nuclease [Candidatus Fimisoma sp.]
MISSLTIHGLRGFGEERTIQFAIPNGQSGSGLTIMVGANNSGKTTIFEALRSFNSPKNNPPSFSERKRNVKCENGKVHLLLKTTDIGDYKIDTIDSGGSTTTMCKVGDNEDEWWEGPKVFVLQSRRFVDYEFHHSYMERSDYVRNQQMNIHNRTSSIYEFNARLFKMQSNKESFDVLLQQVLGYDLEWTIEQNDNGMYFLKLIVGGCSHSSEGLGDGIWSVFTICDALYDSEPNSTIAIDEPELSLHPAYQKRILKLFKEYAKDRQIIINTHSPYFVDMDSLIHGANLYRTIKNADGNIDVFLLSDESKRSIEGFLKDINQPHTLGTEAKEMFFLEDRIIITEGQEDVIMYNKAVDAVNIPLNGTFFGWGSGGSSNIIKVATILKDLGYKKVVAIFDGDKPTDRQLFNEKFPSYIGLIISAPDVRDKPSVNKPEKQGIMTQNGKLKEPYRTEITELFTSINGYFGS